MPTFLPSDLFALSGYPSPAVLQAMADSRARRQAAMPVMPLGVPQQPPQQQQQQQSSSPPTSLIKQFMNRTQAGATPQLGGYGTLSPSQTMAAYNAAPSSFTAPGFEGIGMAQGDPYAFADLSGAGGGLGGGAMPATGAEAGVGSSAGGTAGSTGLFGSGSSGLAAFGWPMAFAAMIGAGKNTEANHPNTPEGDASLAMLGPSAAQMWKDPLGMGLPTLLGVPFITPFTGSQDAKKTKPEWSGMFPLGF